jgi:hypothetical protein
MPPKAAPVDIDGSTDHDSSPQLAWGTLAARHTFNPNTGFSRFKDYVTSLPSSIPQLKVSQGLLVYSSSAQRTAYVNSVKARHTYENAHADPNETQATANARQQRQALQLQEYTCGNYIGESLGDRQYPATSTVQNGVPTGKFPISWFYFPQLILSRNHRSSMLYNP